MVEKEKDSMAQQSIQGRTTSATSASRQLLVGVPSQPLSQPPPHSVPQ